MSTYTDLSLPARILGVMDHLLVGHLDPQFVEMMTQIQDMLRQVFQTQNRLTIPVSETGSVGMEAALCSLIEPGDPVLVCVKWLRWRAHG